MPCGDKQGRRPWDVRGRDWNAAGASQEMLRIIANHLKLGNEEGSSLQVSKGARPREYFGFGFQASWNERQ